MLNTASLSLEQAPPISIPFRFFLSAPLFGIVSGFLVLFYGETLFVSRWSPLMLGLTHLMTLGYLTMVMCGAMLQMLPVIAGSPVPHVVMVGASLHVLLVLGTLALVLAFLTGTPLIMLIALIALGVGLSAFTVAVAIAQWRVISSGATVGGMKLAVSALLLTLLLGSIAALGYAGIIRIPNLAILADVHLGWGLLGWMGLLLISVSFQLVPMFQVTPEYPLWVKRFLPWMIFVALLIWLLLRSGWIVAAWISLLALLVLMVVVFGFVLFSIYTLLLQSRRKRRAPDVTLLFWRLGMILLAGSAMFWLSGVLFPPVREAQYFSILLGIGLVQGVALSVVNGMLYKIVPFLCWFHLQNRQMNLMCMMVSVPNMKEFVTDRAAKRQFYLHLSALLFSAAAAVMPLWFSRPAALLFIASNLLLLINLFLAVGRFRATFKLLEPTTQESVC
ncbi:MAG: hypothetical protein KDI83_11625 [Gammaproteobacteria bacterium]|nr:hypothetical protein [Gammaproteobacteria bacterium]